MPARPFHLEELYFGAADKRQSGHERYEVVRDHLWLLQTRKVAHVAQLTAHATTLAVRSLRVQVRTRDPLALVAATRVHAHVVPVRARTAQAFVYVLAGSAIEAESVALWTAAGVGAWHVHATTNTQMLIAEFNAFIRVSARLIIRGRECEARLTRAAIRSPQVDAVLLTDAGLVGALVDVGANALVLVVVAPESRLAATLVRPNRVRAIRIDGTEGIVRELALIYVETVVGVLKDIAGRTVATVIAGTVPADLVVRASVCAPRALVYIDTVCAILIRLVVARAPNARHALIPTIQVDALLLPSTRITLALIHVFAHAAAIHHVAGQTMFLLTDEHSWSPGSWRRSGAGGAGGARTSRNIANAARRHKGSWHRHTLASVRSQCVPAAKGWPQEPACMRTQHAFVIVLAIAALVVERVTGAAAGGACAHVRSDRVVAALAVAAVVRPHLALVDVGAGARSVVAREPGSAIAHVTADRVVAHLVLVAHVATTSAALVDIYATVMFLRIMETIIATVISRTCEGRCSRCGDY